MAERRNTEFGDFLRTRRERLNPAAVGLPGTYRRRVPGLRREELARLADVSPDYYTRLEQGRQTGASPAILDALARTLRLSAEERTHLYDLARAVDPKPSAVPASAPLSPTVRAMFEALGSTPAIACGPFADIVAANDAACFLYADFPAMPVSERNTIRWMLLAPVARELYGSIWEQTAAEMIGKLRLDAGRHPGDPRAADLVAELEETSALFQRVWREHEISTCVQGTKTLHHARAGTLEFVSEAVTAVSDLGIVFYLMIPSNLDVFAKALSGHHVSH